MRADANDITCRLLNKSDAPQVRALWEYCFKDTKEFVELYFQKCFRAENTVGAYRGEKLLAAAQLNPYTLNLRGQKIPVSYIVGVETTPEERGSGAARALMRELLTQSAERGCYLTLLMPFSSKFYQAYGWSYAYARWRYRINLAELKPLGTDYGKIELVPAMEKVADLTACYQTFGEKYNGVALRDEKHFRVLAQDLQNDGGYCAVVYQNGAPEGYIFYLFGTDTIVVREFVYKNYRAKAALMQYLYRHRSQFEKVDFFLPQADASYLFLENKNAAAIEPYMMARIADVKQFLESLSYRADNISLKIKVNDSFAANNNNVFSLQIQDGCVEVGILADDSGEIELEIGSLSAVVMGVSAKILRGMGKITVYKEDSFRDLLKLWPEENNYINEDY